MKKIIILALLATTINASAQKIPKATFDSAKKYYILFASAVSAMTQKHGNYNAEAFDLILDQYKKYRILCLSYCTAKTDSTRYYAKVIAAWKKYERKEYIKGN